MLFPSWVSDSCRDLISKLLERDLTKRLGLTHGGVRTIRQHPWFMGLNWDNVYKKKEIAPYRPKLSDPFDSSKFDVVPEDPAMNAVYKDDGSAWDHDF